MKFTKTQFITLLLFVLLVPNIKAIEPIKKIQNFTSVDGASPTIIISLLQDKRGYIWQGSWDGLYRYDGISFKSYKILDDIDFQLLDSRIERIFEDSDGNIWCMSYNQKIYYLDIQTEKFNPIPKVPHFQNIEYSATNIVPTPKSGVWIATKDQGALWFEKNTNTEKEKTRALNIESGDLMDNCINLIAIDSKGDSWLLTNNGIAYVQEGKIKHLFTEPQNSKQKQPFYSFLELDDQYLFGSHNGLIWSYDKKKETFSLIQQPLRGDVTVLKELASGQIFIGTRGDGFIIQDKDKKNSHHYHSTKYAQMKSNRVQSVYQDKFGDLWIELSGTGVYHIKQGSNQIERLFSEGMEEPKTIGNTRYFIGEDSAGFLWVVPKGGGLNYYDRVNNRLRFFHNSPNEENRLFHHRIHEAMLDKQGNIWVSPFSRGLVKISPFTPLFNEEEYMDNTQSQEVRSIFVDQHERRWIGARNSKINITDKNGKFIGYLCTDGSINTKGQPLEGTPYVMYEDNKGRIWMGGRYTGLICVTPTEKKEVYKIQTYLNDSTNLYSISDNNIYSIFQDRRKNIWVGTFGGGINLINEQGKDVSFINHRNKLKSYPIKQASQVRHISSDKNGNILIGTVGGLIGFKSNFDQPEKINFNLYRKQYSDSTSLKVNNVMCVTTTKSGRSFVATYGGGVSEIITRDITSGKCEFRHYGHILSRNNQVALSMIEDSDSTLWIVFENSITSFDTRTHTFKSYEHRFFNTEPYFSEAIPFKDKQGRIWVGTNQSLLSFNPREIVTSQFIPQIRFTQLNRGGINIPSYTHTKDGKNIDYTEELIFPAQERNFSIEFAAMDYLDPKNIEYSYYLEGFDNSWQYTDKQPIAYYTNIPHGKYVLHVRSTNSDGMWVDNERTLPITIEPTFWETGWAILLYIIAFILILGGFSLAISIIIKLKSKVSLEQQVNDVKMRFFTDISHELRTPLTLISSPIAEMVNEKDISPEIKQRLNIVYQNTERLLRMTNQLLDFNKLESQKMKLQIEQSDLVSFTKKVTTHFDFLVKQKKIEFQVHSSSETIDLWFDKDKMEKILFNLISNAFKYTPSQKRIDITLQENENNVHILIQDEGKGIPREFLTHLFKRFENHILSWDEGQPSSGIGLAVVNQLVMMHHGSIEVKSETNQGALFDITLPKGCEHFKKDTMVEFLVEKSTEMTKNYSSSEPEITPTNITEKEKYSILVVEDNDDLREFIADILSGDYTIFQASNGKEGLKKAIEQTPDFIVSDIMMPEMDGIEMVKSIRSDLRISHIPILLLTAKATIEDQIAGIETGVEDYLTKPFNAQYLKIRIANLLKRRIDIQNYLREPISKPNNIPQTSTTASVVPSQEELFLEKAKQYFIQHIEQEEITIDQIAEYMGMSRTVFYKKIKHLTGLAPIDYFKELRLSFAANLLSNNDLSIAQIAYMSGYSDPKYFAKCFKQKMGVTPSQYRNSI